ncbi:hypothetical protein F5X96DRAFT_381843 [Biscogniauxia mediterranea]|nr:hypothetical protein F5X96DRAFT_381843 [Biscogniauxia mediterranea]
MGEGKRERREKRETGKRERDTIYFILGQCQSWQCLEELVFAIHHFSCRCFGRSLPPPPPHPPPRLPPSAIPPPPASYYSHFDYSLISCSTCPQTRPLGSSRKTFNLAIVISWDAVSSITLHLAALGTQDRSCARLTEQRQGVASSYYIVFIVLMIPSFVVSLLL